MHRLNHVRRRGKVEFQRVADIQGKDLLPGFGDFVGDNREVADPEFG